MDNMGGLEIVRRVHAHDTRTAVLVFTMHDDPTYATRALKAGAMDFVKKPVGPIQLLARVDSALRISLATRARRTSKDVGVITA